MPSPADRAAWSPCAGARTLLEHPIMAFTPSGPVLLNLDDTIGRRCDTRIKARGVDRDPIRFPDSQFVNDQWATVAQLMLPAPFSQAHWIWALPFRTALLPSCPPSAHITSRTVGISL